jgi:hypothetical protein
MILNAHNLHAPQDVRNGNISSLASSMHKSTSVTSKTMINFVLRGRNETPVGGSLWAYKMIRSGALFDTEGIWLPTRLLVFQLAQFILGIVIVLVLFRVSQIAADEADAARATLDGTEPSWVSALIPTGKDVTVALYTASSITLFVVLLLVQLYIPR